MADSPPPDVFSAAARLAASLGTALLSRSTPTASARAASPTAAAGTADDTAGIGRRLLALTDDPRYELADLAAEYVRLRSTPADAITPAALSAFDAIERDVGRTFGATGTFDSQAQRDRLRRVLACYALRDPEVRVRAIERG